MRVSIFGLHLKTFICISIKNHNWKFKSVSTEQHTLPLMYLQLTQPKQKFDHLLITNCTQPFLLSSYVLCSYDFLKTLYAFLRIGYLYVYPQCHLARETKAIVGTWAVIRVTGVGLVTLASKASLVNISKPDCALNMSVNLCDCVLIEISSLSRHKNVM